MYKYRTTPNTIITQHDIVVHIFYLVTHVNQSRYKHCV